MQVPINLVNKVFRNDEIEVAILEITSLYRSSSFCNNWQKKKSFEELNP